MFRGAHYYTNNIIYLYRYNEKNTITGTYVITINSRIVMDDYGLPTAVRPEPSALALVDFSDLTGG